MLKSILKKDLILDKEKVRYCISNVAKLSILEFIYCKITMWSFWSNMTKTLKQNFKTIYTGIKTFSIGLIFLMANVLSIILLPIALPLYSLKQINQAKEVVKKQEQQTKK